jgi:hypothetical protein
MVSAPPPLPDSVPAQLQGIVLQALQKDPAKRFRDGGELAKAIEAQPIAASVRPVDLSRPRRRHGRTGWYAAAATVALVAAVASASLVRGSASRHAPWWAQEDDFKKLERDLSQSRHARRNTAPQVPVPPVPDHPEEALPFDTRSLPKTPFFDPKTIPGFPGAALRTVDWASVLGARSLWGSGKGEQAERMLRRTLERRPDFVPARLELFALLRRTGRRDEAAGLVRGAEAVGGGAAAEEWRSALVRAYAGASSEKEVLTAAAAVSSKDEDEEDDENDKDQRIAEANYYLGLLRATDSPPDLGRARTYFEDSIEEDSDGPVAGFAREELSSLERALAGSGR